MGVVYILLAAVLFGINPSVEALLLNAGIPSGYVAFWVIMVSGLLALAAGVIRKESFALTRRQLFEMILAGVIGRGATEIFLVMAYTMVPAGVATMVHFFFPTIVCIATVVIFHEKPAWYKLAAIVLSICGLLGIAGGTRAGNIFGIICAGITSFTFAFYYLMTERSDIARIPPMAMLFYLHLFAGIVSAGVVTAGGEWMGGLDMKMYLILFISGFICFMGFVFLNRGIPIIGADIAAFINMLEPVTSILMSILLLHQAITAQTAVGCLLITAALFVSAAGENRLFKRIGHLVGS
jgi:drug/metabolite transporter (DMT)-like permease